MTQTLASQACTKAGRMTVTSHIIPQVVAHPDSGVKDLQVNSNAPAVD